jgi:hypothetical protein
MKHEFARSPIKPSLAIEQIDAAVDRSWTEMASWMPDQRRENLPMLLNAIGRLETRLMVLRQGVKREIAVWNDLVKPSRVGVVPDEDENEGD